ncbi:hypothetical protein AURDEDRAFT_174591 [Auricularia subglabra TFB-10046 SS5]|uniref:F-box domain-containing protein n=1 Tax=Auricularia subglabra (strain TFB-10046 / SS5) TaxID=717982 RepID=J0WU89_AURST|nr:hypothetical protein AURDEDRAFT_174591 [Auricularia subglabra TFB-10046 SS5]
MDRTRTLPDKLWSDTFEFLKLEELCAASQVCSYWRCIAFDHPSFWGTISICSLSVSELGWASRRVIAGRTRPVHLTVTLTDTSTLVETTTLPMIGDVLHRARVLEVIIPSPYFQRLCDILLNSAPVLEWLRLDMSIGWDDQKDLCLPTDLLSGQPHALREVQLECVTLPSTPIPAFVRAESVILSGADGAWHYLSPALFSFFPEVRRLSVFGSGLQVPETISADLHAGFARLDILDVAYYDSENLKVFQYFPTTASIPQIILSHSDRETVKAAISQLPEQLMMIFLRSRHSKDEIRIMYASQDVQHMRSFVELRDYFESGELNAANVMLADAAFARRIATLRISTSLWSLACPFFPPDNNYVEDLIVLVDDNGLHGQERLPTQSFLCPCLRTLIVQAMGDFVRVTVSDLVDLSRIVTQSRIALELHCVVVEGAEDDLARHFTTVLRTNEHTQGTSGVSLLTLSSLSHTRVQLDINENVHEAIFRPDFVL